MTGSEAGISALTRAARSGVTCHTEAGFKPAWLDKRLELNGAAFHYLHAQPAHGEIGRASEAVMPRTDDDDVSFVHVRFKKV